MWLVLREIKEPARGRSKAYTRFAAVAGGDSDVFPTLAAAEAEADSCAQRSSSSQFLVVKAEFVCSYQRAGAIRTPPK